MACLKDKPYSIYGCTDADVYYPNATTVDFRLRTLQNDAGQTFSYTAYLQRWNPSTSVWENYEIKSGSFKYDTGEFSYGISSALAGSYRIKCRYKSDTGTTYFYDYTTTFILQ